MDDLLGEFIAETRETLAPLAGEIVAWEAEPGDRARLDAIFRFVHTVKGSCGFLELSRLERLSHAAEGALADVREGRRTADGALVSAVLAIIDRIGAMVDALEAGHPYPDGGDEALVMALEPGHGSAVPGPLQAAPVAPRAAPRSVRLPVDLLDRMMGGISDLVLARNELGRRLREAAGQGPGHAMALAAFDRLSATIAEMRDAITRTRMQRIDHLFAALPRMVRDLGQELGKTVALELDGADVELDREMIEMIRDPLTHMIRNAIDHGIEAPAARVAAGKPAIGLLRIAARQAGNQILIDIADDGRGVDGEKLAARAVAAGLLTPDEARALPEQRRVALMFEAGLSTAQAVSTISGRGVGMDIVRANVERIGGLVEVESHVGTGTRLTLRVPLTLTIIPAFTLGAGNLRFALPRAAIDEIVRLGPGGATREMVGDGAVLACRGQRLPLASLRAVLGLEDAEPPLAVVVRAAGGQPFALGVDAIHDHEELVIKPAAPAVMATGLYAGTTLPDSGQPMLLLDPAGIAQVARIRLDQATPAAVPQADPVRTAPALLFQDLDGEERAIRLSAVERIEDVPAAAVRRTGGQLLLARGDALVPVLASAPPVEGHPLRVLTMSDGAMDIAYAVDRVIDVVDLPLEMAPAAAPGRVAGVVLHAGRPLELLDPYWLFAEQAGWTAAPAAQDRPLCLLAEDSRWARDILRPLVEGAGYRAVLPGDAGAEAATLVIAGEAGPAAPDPRPVVRVRAAREPADGADATIWRYDRDGLLRALRSAAA